MKKSDCLKQVRFSTFTARIICLAFSLTGLNNSGNCQTDDHNPTGSNNSSTKPVFYYIPHTHWEGAVFKTREEYLDMGLHHIMQAISLMKKYPNYKFALDQVAYIRPFVERYPEEGKLFRKYVKEGRLEIVGGMDVMPDVIKPGGELFVRQMLYGKTWCREALGVDVTVAWLLDTFGHHPQMPQLLRQAGFKSFWFCRGVPNDNMPSEFLWKGIDGSEIPAFMLIGFYGLLYGPPRDQKGFANFFANRFNALNIHVHGNERVGLAGVDVSEPEDYVAPLVTEFNRNSNRPFDIKFSVPTEFERVVSKRTNRPVIAGDFTPLFQGTFSSRAELKQITREIEERLLTAEKLSAITAFMGDEVDPKAILEAWEPILFNQTHDLASGVMTDHVYEDVRRAYDYSFRLADNIIHSKLRLITSKMDTRNEKFGSAIPIVVFNTIGWTRTDVTEVEIGFATTGIRSVTVHDANGSTIPCQIVNADRYSDGGIIRATIRFVAKDVPSMGYTTYFVAGLSSGQSEQKNMPPHFDDNVLENEYYKVTVDLRTGAITSIVDKAQNWEVFSGPANIITHQEDKGDLWELYHGLDGASHIAMTNKQPVPNSSTAQLSSSFSKDAGKITRSSVCTEFSVQHPFGTGSFATRVRLYPGIKRIDIKTDLVNNEKFVRYQALFPTTVKNGKYVQEIPFGAIERPIGVENAAQNWVDYSDGVHGVTLLNHGMPGNLVNDDTLMLSLMRSHSIGGYGFGGGFEPGMTSESGYEIGRPLTFNYSLIPHTGAWQNATAAREGMSFNNPLIPIKVAQHSGTLPKTWSMVRVSHKNVLLTAVKPCVDGTIVRVYEAEGRAANDVQVSLSAKILSANESNLMEDIGAKVSFTKNAIRFSLRPFEIRTFKLRLTE